MTPDWIEGRWSQLTPDFSTYLLYSEQGSYFVIYFLQWICLLDTWGPHVLQPCSSVGGSINKQSFSKDWGAVPLLGIQGGKPQSTKDCHPFLFLWK